MKSILITIGTILFLALGTSFAETGIKSDIMKHDDWTSFKLTFPNGDVLLRMTTSNKNGTMFSIDEIPTDRGECHEAIQIISAPYEKINKNMTMTGYGLLSVQGYAPHRFIFTVTTDAEHNQAFYKLNKIEKFDEFINEAIASSKISFELKLDGVPDDSAVEVFSLTGFTEAMLRGAKICKTFEELMKNRKSDSLELPGNSIQLPKGQPL